MVGWQDYILINNQRENEVLADKKVGMPTMGSFKDALVDFAVGAGGGIVYALSSAITGSGLIGGLVGAGLAGSIIKGTRGTVLATTLGFMTIVGSLGGSAQASAPDSGVM